jgi:hypothetical protein
MTLGNTVADGIVEMTRATVFRDWLESFLVRGSCPKLKVKGNTGGST